MINFTVFATLRAYAGKVRTIRNEIRTERQMNALPPHVRCDIGWPERYADERARRDGFGR